MEAIIISRNSYLISLYIETEINIRPMIYVGQYKNEYKTNQSTSIFIRNVRLKQAEKLLLETNLHVSEIATKVGFKHTSYFINSFRELYGMSPNEWKERERSK